MSCLIQCVTCITNETVSKQYCSKQYSETAFLSIGQNLTSIKQYTRINYMLNHIFHWFALGFTMSARPPGQRLQWIFFKGEAVFVEFHHHPNQASGSTCGGAKESSCYVWNPLVSFYAHHSLSFPCSLQGSTRGPQGPIHQTQAQRNKSLSRALESDRTQLWARVCESALIRSKREGIHYQTSDKAYTLLSSTTEGHRCTLGLSKASSLGLHFNR